MNDTKGTFGYFHLGSSSSVSDPRRSRVVWLCRYCGKCDDPCNMYLRYLPERSERNIHEQKHYSPESRHDLPHDGKATL